MIVTTDSIDLIGLCSKWSARNATHQNVLINVHEMRERPTPVDGRSYSWSHARSIGRCPDPPEDR